MQAPSRWAPPPLEQIAPIQRRGVAPSETPTTKACRGGQTKSRRKRRPSMPEHILRKRHATCHERERSPTTKWPWIVSDHPWPGSAPWRQDSIVSKLLNPCGDTISSCRRHVQVENLHPHGNTHTHMGKLAPTWERLAPTKAVRYSCPDNASAGHGDRRPPLNDGSCATERCVAANCNPRDKRGRWPPP